VTLKLAHYDGRPVLVTHEEHGRVELIPLPAAFVVSEEDELLEGAGKTTKHEPAKTTT
jgi:hypothetical protein